MKSDRGSLASRIFTHPDPVLVAESLKPALEASAATEAVIAFRDPELAAKLTKESLAELGMESPHSFCLLVSTEEEGCYFDLVYSFCSVLETAEDHGWSPSIEVFTAAEAEEAGGLEKLAGSFSAVTRRIFRR